MKRYYTLIAISNRDANGHELVPGQEDKKILCTWTENFINEFVSDTTNTLCTKKLTELVTGETIHPEPEDKLTSRLPRRLEYDTYPQASELTHEEAMKYLQELRNNPEELKEYILYIRYMQELVKLARKEQKTIRK